MISFAGRARALALVTSALFAGAAQAEPPTLDGLLHMSVTDSARVALGPGSEVWVERLPGNGMELNPILNNAHFYQMVFFTRGERIAPGVCAVTVGSATFDTDPAPDASPEVKAAQERLPYNQKPLRWDNFERLRLYFAGGPARATTAAQAADSCDNPISGREVFRAPSQDDAITAVTALRAAVSAAKASRPLPLDVSIRCFPGEKTCPSARTQLAALDPQVVSDVRAGDCSVFQGAMSCLDVDVGHHAISGGEYWTVSLGRDAHGRVRQVSLAHMFPPVL